MSVVYFVCNTPSCVLEEKHSKVSFLSVVIELDLEERSYISTSNLEIIRTASAKFKLSKIKRFRKSNFCNDYIDFFAF